MVNQQRLHAALRHFAHTLVHRYEIGEVLYRLSDDVTDVLGTTGSGVSLIDETGELRFVTATGEAVEEAERLQDRFGEGPCWSAAATAKVMVVYDLRTQGDRWPSSLVQSSIGGCHPSWASRCTWRAPPSAPSTSTPTSRAHGPTTR